MTNLKMRSYQHSLIIYIYTHTHWTIQLGISEIIHCNLPLWRSEQSSRVVLTVVLATQIWRQNRRKDHWFDQNKNTLAQAVRKRRTNTVTTLFWNCNLYFILNDLCICIMYNVCVIAKQIACRYFSKWLFMQYIATWCGWSFDQYPFQSTQLVWWTSTNNPQWNTVHLFSTSNWHTNERKFVLLFDAVKRTFNSIHVWKTWTAK